MNKRRPLNQYAGRLTVQQAAEGIAVALRNAYSLVRDAELLLQHGRHARATALAILAIEEAGKVPIIRAILLARTEAELRDEWRAYRSHTKKNVLYILPELINCEGCAVSRRHETAYGFE
jgi:AbiV family abortive infection protein